MSKILEKKLDEALGVTADLIACNILGPACPAEHTDENEEQRRYRKYAEQIQGIRMAAISVLLASRSALVPLLESNNIDSSCFYELEFPIDYSDENDVCKASRLFERIHVILGRLAEIIHSETDPQHRRSMMTDAQREVWNLLDGQAFTAKDLASRLPGEPTEAAVAKRIQELRKAGHKIWSKRGRGYHRVDSPPES